jgi:hypothetical protein
MPNDLTISAVGTPVASPDRVQSYQPAPTAAAAPKASASPLPNPTLRFDAVLGMLVIEFRNDAGDVASSIPTQRQLDAYRLRFDTASPPGSPPVPTDHPARGAAAVAETASPPVAKPPIVA